jgi:hypothetical protein
MCSKREPTSPVPWASDSGIGHFPAGAVLCGKELPLPATTHPGITARKTERAHSVLTLPGRRRLRQVLQR